MLLALQFIWLFYRSMEMDLSEAIDIVEIYLIQEADFLADQCAEDCVDEERTVIAAIRTVLTVAKQTISEDS